MFGFARKKGVERLADSISEVIVDERIKGKERTDKVREECLNYVQKIDNFHSEHIELILEHLGLRVIPRSTQTTTTTTPAHLVPMTAKPKKRTAKAKSGDVASDQ